MMELLKPILIETKFKAIPKMVVAQFCRGSSMCSTMMVDGSGPETSDLTKEVNGQACFSKLILRPVAKLYKTLFH